MSAEADDLDELMAANREALAAQAEEAGLPALAVACRAATTRRELLEATEADLGALGLASEQACAAVQAGEIVAWLLIALEQVARMSWAPDEDAEA